MRGRVLMFVASVFPLSDKSGVNLRSTVAGNVTEFDQSDEPNVTTTTSTTIDKPEPMLVDMKNAVARFFFFSAGTPSGSQLCIRPFSFEQQHTATWQAD